MAVKCCKMPWNRTSRRRNTLEPSSLADRLLEKIVAVLSTDSYLALVPLGLSGCGNPFFNEVRPPEASEQLQIEILLPHHVEQHSQVHAEEENDTQRQPWERRQHRGIKPTQP